MNIESIAGIAAVFVVLPWMMLHYITRWKTAATLTAGDEQLLDELYRVARRLEERLETVERLVATEHPQFRPGGALDSGSGADRLSELDRLLSEKRGVRL